MPVEDFALVSDMAYSAQNGGRIIRALLEIGISRKWANVSAVLMGLSKAVEKRMWPGKKADKDAGGRAMVLFEKMDLHIAEKWAGKVDAMLLGCVRGRTIV